MTEVADTEKVPAPAGFAHTVIIPMTRSTVNRFPRKDLETFARVQFCLKLPQHLVLAEGARFTYALAENRMAQTSWTHMMRVVAQVERTR